MRCCSLLAAGLLLIASTSPSSAQDARTRIARGKAATAYVEVGDVKKAGSATAFCLHPSGIFVTNQHVVKNVAADGKVKLVLDPNGEKPREMQATVLRSDATEDLAILKVAEAKDAVPVLELGDDGNLFETMSVTAFGYPFGKKLSVDNGAYPEITVSAGRITSLRRQEGKLHRIQVDAQLNPGDSGGPVLDETGKVVGIVQAGVLASGVNFVIPVSRLRTLLQKPDVSVEIGAIPHAGRHAEQVAVVTVVPFLEKPAAPSVELELSVEGQETRKVAATAAGDGKFVVRFVPLPAPRETAKVWVEGVASYPSGSVTGRFEDVEVRIGDRTVRLKEIRRIEQGPQPGLVLHDGSRIEGAPRGLDALNVDLGPARIALPFASAARFEGRPSLAGPPQGTYAFVVRDGEAEIARATGPLRFAPDPQSERPATAAELAGISFRRYAGGEKTVELPDTFADVIPAAGGRLLLLHLPKTKKLAVFDLNETKVVRFVDLSFQDAIVVAGLNRMFVVSKTDSLVERWSLSTFERETVKQFPFTGKIKTMAWGCASTGPVLVHWAVGTDVFSQAKYSLLDPDSLEVKDLAGYRPSHGHYRDSVQLRVSGTGDVYSMWQNHVSPSGVEAMTVVEGTARGNRLHESQGHLVPAFDGSAILTGTGRILTPDLTTKGTLSGSLLVPTTHPRFCTAIPQSAFSSFPTYTRPGAAEPTTKASVVSITSASRLVDLPDLKLGKQNIHPARIGDDSLTFEKRVFLVPQADLLVTLPVTNDRLHVQRFSLLEAQQKAGIDYFYVESIPRRQCGKGQRWSYQIEVASKAGGLQYELSSGPPGMQVSPTGLVTWDVPADFADAAANVIVAVKNGAGLSLYETFALSVR